MSTESPAKINPWVKPLLLITIVLILPLALLAIWGEAFINVAEYWQQHPPSRTAMCLTIAGILASDVFLPVPSGPISTLAGSQLGVVPGTIVSTIGMTIGAVIAFSLARAWGRPLAERYSSVEQLAELENSCSEHGVWMVLVTRPLPILAEACALLVGALQMSWRQFLPAILLSNALISATYALLGQQAATYGWLPLAVCTSAAIPLLVTWWWRKRRKSADSVT